MHRSASALKPVWASAAALAVLTFALPVRADSGVEGFGEALVLGLVLTSVAAAVSLAAWFGLLVMSVVSALRAEARTTHLLTRGLAWLNILLAVAWTLIGFGADGGFEPLLLVPALAHTAPAVYALLRFKKRAASA